MSAQLFRATTLPSSRLNSISLIIFLPVIILMTYGAMLTVAHIVDVFPQTSLMAPRLTGDDAAS